MNEKDLFHELNGMKERKVLHELKWDEGEKGLA